MRDIIYRQDAIDTDGLDEEIRCEMCKNPMHTDRGCDGNCKYDEILYEKIIQILDKRITPLPAVQPEQSESEDITFWKKRAREYEEMVLKLTDEMARGIKIDSVLITEEGIVFKKEKLEQRWIPVSERLPDVAQRVLLSGHGQVMIGMLHSFGKYSLEPTGILYGYPKDDIEAWMPLPEPYKREGEQNEIDY